MCVKLERGEEKWQINIKFVLAPTMGLFMLSAATKHHRNTHKKLLGIIFENHQLAGPKRRLSCKKVRTFSLRSALHYNKQKHISSGLWLALAFFFVVRKIVSRMSRVVCLLSHLVDVADISFAFLVNIMSESDLATLCGREFCYGFGAHVHCSRKNLILILLFFFCVSCV